MISNIPPCNSAACNALSFRQARTLKGACAAKMHAKNGAFFSGLENGSFHPYIPGPSKVLFRTCQLGIVGNMLVYACQNEHNKRNTSPQKDQYNAGEDMRWVTKSHGVFRPLASQPDQVFRPPDLRLSCFGGSKYLQMNL